MRNEDYYQQEQERDRDEYYRQQEQEAYEQQCRDDHENDMRLQARADAEAECSRIQAEISSLEDRIEDLKSRQYSIMKDV